MGKMSRVLSISLLFLISIAMPIASTDSDVSHLRLDILTRINIEDGLNATWPKVVVDSDNQYHTVWIRDGDTVMYSLHDIDNTPLIQATKISNSESIGLSKVDLAVDGLGFAHIVWSENAVDGSIIITVLNPHESLHDGQQSTDNELSSVDDHVLFDDSGDEIRSWPSWPTIAIDNRENIHIVWTEIWVDDASYFNKPQIFYAMINYSNSVNELDVLIDATELTHSVSNKGIPTISIDDADRLTISWDDTRGSEVELVFIVDTSGSMSSVWDDLCTILYGGQFTNGIDFIGLKEIASQNNFILYETIYGLGNYLPESTQTGDCQKASPNGADGEGPRNTSLGLYPSDDSGGIRKLALTVYNGQTYAGYSGEDWGPGSNWACLSWRDAQGSIPGNPPTSADHHWNPNATKIVIPMSDEGPKDGDPAGQSDDHQAIQEAHDSCVRAGVIPVGLYGQSWGGATTVQSHYLDLAHCPDGTLGTHTRNCPGTTIANTDAGGHVNEYSTDGGDSKDPIIQSLVNAMTDNSYREIFFTSINPYHLVENPSFTLGSTGLNENNSEDLGGFILVNDTRLTNHNGSSIRPSVAHSSDGSIHFTWMDGRDNGITQAAPHEIYHASLDFISILQSNSNGGSIQVSNFFNSQPMLISTISQSNEVSDNHDAYPVLLIPLPSRIFITWISYSDGGTNDTIINVELRQNSTTMTITSSILSNWESDKSPHNLSTELIIGSGLSTFTDNNAGLRVVWSDSYDCSTLQVENTFNICQAHMVNFVDSDGDGVDNADDQCPGFDDNIDVDGDGIPDGCDSLIDSDGDGVADSEDACPNYDDSIDVDQDGIVDGCDELIDSDGDGVSNTNDSFPADSSEWNDTDGDGVGDNSDQCLGFDDNIDVDLDGTPDGCDELVDSDGDSVADDVDNCPNESNIQQSDHDLDLIGDECDSDSDNDGIQNADDKCPNGQVGWISSNATDIDSDGCLDANEDIDDDGDGILDINDGCPLGVAGWDSEDWEDNDGDGCPDTPVQNDNNSGSLGNSSDDTGIGNSSDGNGDNSNVSGGEESFASVDGFLDRLKSGDLDAIGILLALTLPIVGITISQMRKSRRRTIVTTMEDKIFDTNTHDNLDILNQKAKRMAATDQISQSQYQVVIEAIKERTNMLELADSEFDIEGEGTKEIPVLQFSQTPPAQMAGTPDVTGYEWLDADGAKWHRVTGSGSEWIKWE